MTIRAVVQGVGHYLPEKIVPNSAFEKTLETSDEWIRTRSGIERRHFAAEGETTSDMGIIAARRALRRNQHIQPVAPLQPTSVAYYGASTAAPSRMPPGEPSLGTE